MRNIQERKRSNGTVYGYRVTKQIDGTKYNKTFSGYDVDQCLKDAKAYLECISRYKGDTLKLFGEPLKPAIRPDISNGIEEPVRNGAGCDSSRKGVIYMITNTSNGKRYIGQTRLTRKRGKHTIRWSAHDRWCEHVKHAHNGGDSCHKLSRAINKYGDGSFKVETLEVVPLDELDSKEEYYISMYDTMSTGYNILPGGQFRNTDETRAKISAASSNRWKDPDYKLRFSNRRRDMYKDIHLKSVMSDDTLPRDFRLPMYLYWIKKHSVIIGIQAKYNFDGKKGSKCFSRSGNTMKEKFELAQTWLRGQHITP